MWLSDATLLNSVVYPHSFLTVFFLLVIIIYDFRFVIVTLHAFTMYLIVSCVRTNSLYCHKSAMVNASLDKYRNKHQPRHVSLPVCFLCLLWNWKAGSSKLLCMFIFPKLAGLIGFRCLGSDWKRFFWKWNLTSTFFCQFQFFCISVYAEEHIVSRITRTLTPSRRDPSRQTPSPEAPSSIATNWMCV